MLRGRTIQWAIGVAAALLSGAAPLYAQQCDDGQECTAGMCSDGMCIGTPQTSGGCNDFDDCTVNDHCQPDGSCSGEPAPVGTACTGGCGTCQRLTPDSPLMCTGKSSDNDKPCDAGNPCIESKCVIAGTSSVFCLFLQLKECPDTDGNPCTDFCNFETGQCEPDVPKCFATCETCNTSTGACEPANIGAACDDFDPCTVQSRCDIVDVGDGVQRGLCRPGEPTVMIPTPTTSPSVTPTESPTPRACVGDCDGNGRVVINELVLGVNIALDNAAVGRCSALDVDNNKTIEVNELIGGVNALLNGCPS